MKNKLTAEKTKEIKTLINKFIPIKDISLKIEIPKNKILSFLEENVDNFNLQDYEQKVEEKTIEKFKHHILKHKNLNLALETHNISLIKFKKLKEKYPDLKSFFEELKANNEVKEAFIYSQKAKKAKNPREIIFLHKTKKNIELEELKKLILEGYTVKQIKEKLKISRQTIYNNYYKYFSDLTINKPNITENKIKTISPNIEKEFTTLVEKKLNIKDICDKLSITSTQYNFLYKKIFKGKRKKTQSLRNDLFKKLYLEDKLSQEEIIQKMGISRSSFYAHCRRLKN